MTQLRCAHEEAMEVAARLRVDEAAASSAVSSLSAKSERSAEAAVETLTTLVLLHSCAKQRHVVRLSDMVHKALESVACARACALEHEEARETELCNEAQQARTLLSSLMPQILPTSLSPS